MTITFAVNPNTNDLMIGAGGKLQRTYGADEVRQRILIALQHYWQEYFLNVPSGVPWFEVILGGKDIKLAEAILRKTILDVPNVLSILAFSASFSGRRLAISAQVEVSGINGPSIVTIIENLPKAGA